MRVIILEVPPPKISRTNLKVIQICSVCEMFLSILPGGPSRLFPSPEEKVLKCQIYFGILAIGKREYQ